MSVPDAANATPTPLDSRELAPALEAIRANCHISDARHAADYTLCIYLLKMREYFRWEHGLPFEADLPREQLTRWISAREQHWDTLADEPLRPVPVNGNLVDPFDTTAINRVLNKLGYVYSSGYGRNMKPVFFLGELEARSELPGYTLLVSDREHARDLSAPPAMSRDDTIFVRRESLRRMCWEKIEEWRWNRPDNAMHRAMQCYDFESAPLASLDAMTDREVKTAILHEIGEIEAGKRLGPDWEAMLASMPTGKAELMLRAVRDNLADALSTLPGLMEEKDPASMHFYIANLGSLRKTLFPALVPACERWHSGTDMRELEALVRRSSTHWQTVAKDCLKTYRQNPQHCAPELVSMIEAGAI